MLWTRVYVGALPHTVAVYNRATMKGDIYPDYEYDSTVTELVPKVYGQGLTCNLEA